MILAASVLGTAVRAQDPAVKDLLGKAQTQTETKAVEDLITKLKRQQVPSAKPGTSASERTPAPDTGPQADPPEPSSNSHSPQASEKSAAAIKTEDTTSSTAPPPPEIVGLETEQMPNVDLEVLFEYNSARIAPATVATLATLGRALTDPRLARDSFLIAGHTDAKGGANHNLRLSQQRAESVRDFLVRHFNVAPNRLVAKGFGQRRLKDPQKPFDEKNRRVQIINFIPPKAQ